MIGTEIIQRPVFDYESLDAETRTIVQARVAEIHTLVRVTADAIVKIGRRLAEIQPLLGESWRAWLQQEFTWSERTAYNFIKVYKVFGDKPSLSRIAPSALYLLSSPSAPETARHTALSMADNGETVTHTKARKLILKSLGKSNGVDRKPEPKGFSSWLTAEPETKDCPELFYVNRLTMAIQNGYVNLKADRLTYALHNLAELIKEHVPLHPPKSK